MLMLQDERGRLMRRTIVRYVCLCLTMVLTMISPRVKKRFPTLNNLVDAGLLLENEKAILDHLNEKFPKPSKHWLVFKFLHLCTYRYFIQVSVYQYIFPLVQESPKSLLLILIFFFQVANCVGDKHRNKGPQRGPDKR